MFFAGLLGTTFTPIEYAVLEAALGRGFRFEVSALLGLVLMLRSSGHSLCSQDAQGRLSVPGVTVWIELALALPSLTRWHSRPALRHKGLDSVPVISLMKYLHRVSGCQFSKLP